MLFVRVVTCCLRVVTDVYVILLNCLTYGTRGIQRADCVTVKQII